MQCPKCGNPIEASDLFCGECGTKLSHQTNTTNETKTNRTMHPNIIQRNLMQHKYQHKIQHSLIIK